MSQTKQLRAIDGFAFGAYEAMPSAKPRGGIVVIQEIFGVNSHIRNVADGYAAAGYAAHRTADLRPRRAQRGARL